MPANVSLYVYRSTQISNDDYNVKTTGQLILPHTTTSQGSSLTVFVTHRPSFLVERFDTLSPGHHLVSLCLLFVASLHLRKVAELRPRSFSHLTTDMENRETVYDNDECDYYC